MQPRVLVIVLSVATFAWAGHRDEDGEEESFDDVQPTVIPKRQPHKSPHERSRIVGELPLRKPRPGEPRIIPIAISDRGFSPASIAVKRGEKVELVFVRRTERACSKGVVIPIGSEPPIERKLPLRQPASVVVSFPEAGEVRFACTTGEHTARVVVKGSSPLGVAKEMAPLPDGGAPDQATGTLNRSPTP